MSEYVNKHILCCRKCQHCYDYDYDRITQPRQPVMLRLRLFYTCSESLSTLQRYTYICAASRTVLHFKTETSSHAALKSNDDMTDRPESQDAINVRRSNIIEFSRVDLRSYTMVNSPPMLFSGFIPFIIRLGEGDL